MSGTSKGDGAKPRSSAKKPSPTGIAAIDSLAAAAPCTIDDYIKGVSAYVREQSKLGSGAKKASQIRLSNALARALAHEIERRLPKLAGRLVTDEQKVAGGLRTANADVSESHRLDGLRLAVELKPINLAIGRAIWNRFGDLRTFAVNLHLKFPFAVVGGVLVIPTYEETGTRAAREAERYEANGEKDQDDVHAKADEPANDQRDEGRAPARKPTVHLVQRAIERLVRAGGRRSEADAAHLLEGIAVVVYDPETSTIHPDIPEAGSGLRWEEFVEDLVSSYRARFED